MKAIVSAALYISAKCRANFIPFHKNVDSSITTLLIKSANEISLPKWQLCGSGSERFEEI
jgi:hypothetical protein